MTEATFRAGPGEASYATLAHVINATLAPEEPVTRQQVYAWHTRKTVNASGTPFPEPVRTVPEAERKQGQPSVFFSTREVIRWLEEGMTEHR